MTCVLLLVAISGCGSAPELDARSGAVPPGADLTGRWQLRAGDDGAVRSIEKAGADAAGGVPVVQRRRPTNPSRPRRARDGLVHVFLETGKSLKITQTAHGIFISFDRSVVEEYRFGEKRQVSVGPVVAQRVSGWEGESYIIETLDADGVVLRERYWLSDDRQVLNRRVTISQKDQQQLDVRMVFDRV